MRPPHAPAAMPRFQSPADLRSPARRPNRAGGHRRQPGAQVSELRQRCLRVVSARNARLLPWNDTASHTTAVRDRGDAWVAPRHVVVEVLRRAALCVDVDCPVLVPQRLISLAWGNDWVTGERLSALAWIADRSSSRSAPGT